MRVLLIKISSMGDVIHALPALTDAIRAIPEIRFDWVVEEAFQEIPAWHPAVDRVIPVALRRWRKSPLKTLFSGEWQRFKKDLRKQTYDLVLDSQGLIKSAWLASKARGVRAGYDKESAREPLASWFYQKKIAVDSGQHAITRQRILFASILGYDTPDSQPDSGISKQRGSDTEQPYVLLMHGTSWLSKEWPERHWIALARIMAARGYQIRLVWGNAVEKTRAQRIAEASGAKLLEKKVLSDLVTEIVGASFIVGVDSGLAHLAAALGAPAVTLYGATDVRKTGAIGARQKNIVGTAPCAPCMKRDCRNLDERNEPICWKNVGPERVWEEIGIVGNEF